MKTFSLIALLLLLTALPVQAAGPQSAAPLSPEDRQILAPLDGIWQDLPPHRQRQLVNRARQWSTMSPEQRRRLKQRFQRFREMPPDQRQQLQRRYQRFQTLPPEEQEALRRKWREQKRRTSRPDPHVQDRR